MGDKHSMSHGFVCLACVCAGNFGGADALSHRYGRWTRQRRVGGIISDMRTFLVCGCLAAVLLRAADPNSIDLKAPEVRLWPKDAPGSEGVTASELWNPVTDGFHRVRNIHQPSLTVFLPAKEKATGVAYVICPGGGHNYLVMDLEGANVARRLNAMGIAAFILKSRLAHTPGFNYKVDVESLADARRAIRTVRARAGEWGVDAGHVGIMGFSAGGELAAYAETRFDRGKADSPDAVDRQSSRPDFVVLAYPGGKAANLTVTKETPATFIVVNNDDALAPASVDYYSALRKVGVPVELLIFNRGGHGFGMTGRTPAFAQLPVAGWPAQFESWMKDMGFLQ
jgi:acetyl esterase/lipase